LERAFTVILTKEEEGGYSVRCVELPGAISQGETQEEALKNIKDAITLVVCSFRVLGAFRARSLKFRKSKIKHASSPF